LCTLYPKGVQKGSLDNEPNGSFYEKFLQVSSESPICINKGIPPITKLIYNSTPI
jgi:hypothetical protein